MIRTALAATGAAVICAFAAFTGPRLPFDGTIVSHKVADVVLTDDHGRAYRFGDVPVRGTIVVVGYTRCRDQCPMTMARVTAAVARLPLRSRPRVVFLTIDPERDTAADLRRFTSIWSVPVVGITGSRSDLERAVSSLGSVMPGPGAVLLHDARIAFIAGDGEVRASVESDAGDGRVSEALRSIGPPP